MALNSITADRGDYEYYGSITFTELSGNNFFDVYELVRTDLLPYFNDIRLAGFVSFKAFTNVTSFDSTIVQLYGGNPPRYRFGTYTLRNADTYFENEFITYEKQQFRKGKTWVVNDEPSPLTVFVADPEAPLIGIWTQLLDGIQYDQGTPVATGLEIDLNNSVEVTIRIVYSGQLSFYFDGDVFPEQVYINI
jgi:hypothetical protein